MTIKLIVSDMDGTLLRRDNTISSQTSNALIAAQQKGIRLVLASGRTYRKLMEYAKQLQMPEYGGYLIEVNGTAVYDLGAQKRTRLHQFHKADMTAVFEALAPFEVEILGMGDDSMYDYIPQSMMALKQAYRKKHHLPEDAPWTAGAFSFIFDNRIGYPHQYTIQSGADLPASLNKLAVAHLPQCLESKLPQIRAALKDKYWVGLTSPGWLEIMPKGVTKGNALLALCHRLHIDLADVIAFGDGENDIEMLKLAGIGVAMDNALPTVKTNADYVCSDNQTDGLAKALAKFL